MSLKFDIFASRRSAHGQSTMVAPERREGQEHHQTHETDEEARNVVGEKETRIILIDIPTKIGGECRSTQGNQTENRTREDKVAKIAIVQTTNAVVY